MVLEVVGLLVGMIVVSGLVSAGLGLDEDGYQYDPIKEQMVFVPSRYDVVLDMMMRSI
jgi:hypothetical protein